ncbi:flagellar protein export ATPase FliI [Methylocella silvestris]|uniref:Flagellum-specific ATP synthase n=1 Tax=Methylocella silvestris TaxID=199596 RepID=A0A2J7TID8_METSI|nr:flagellar protein export ATPase FliI [Methylocella silvestris]PNG26541.1 flagellum-specific ATP synthase FliI [Methylocella silvestris]
MSSLPAADGALAKLERAMTQAATEPLVRISGAVAELSPSHARVAGLSPFVKLGECVRFGLGADAEAESASSRGEVVRIDPHGVIVKTFEAGALTGLGARVFCAGPLRIAPHPGWKGRVVNAFGAPIDGAGPLPQGDRGAMIDAPPPSAMRRARVAKPLRTGVRVIDIFTPLCAGQRIGIFAGSGVGKSTLLAMLAGSRDFDTVVVALVGERGREVREFLDDALAANRAISVAVVATGDETPSMRRLAPRTAMAIAEFFRDRGDRVLLIIDSVTRFAHAARDVALAAGEPPVARGYTPSVFSDLPKLLERAGPGEEGGGSITGVFSVLVDGDDHNDPVADAVRGTLDGHIVLDRAIADQGRFPAVNVLGSISRLAQIAWTDEQRDLVLKLRGMIARFEDTSDLRLMGGYKAGQDADLDQAVVLVPKIYKTLQQSPQSTPSADAFRELAQSLTGAS